MHFEFTEAEVVALKLAASFALREGIIDGDDDDVASAARKLGIDLDPDVIGRPDGFDPDVIN